MKTKTPKNQDVESILNACSVYPGTLLERILTYIEQNDLDPQEIGDILEEDPQFKDFFYVDLVANNEIIDKDLKEIINQRDEDVW